MLKSFLPLLLIGRLAWRNLVSSPFRSLVLAGLLCFTSVLLILSTAVTSSIAKRANSSVVESVSGHLQIYSSEATRPLEFFSAAIARKSDPVLPLVPEIGALQDIIQRHPNVLTTVPMATGTGVVITPTRYERTLEDLRLALQTHSHEHAEHLVQHLKTMTARLIREGRAELSANPHMHQLFADLLELDTAAFWESMHDDSESFIEFLEERALPYAGAAPPKLLSYITADFEQLQENFSRFELVLGRSPEENEAGILVNHYTYEKVFKHPVARALDYLHENRRKNKNFSADVATYKKKMLRHASILASEVSPQYHASVCDAVAAFFSLSVSPNIDEAITLLLDVSVHNVVERREFFYDYIAPRIRLYDVLLGEELVIHGVDARGYSTAVAVPVLGTFQLKGFDKSFIAGAYSFLDLHSWRSLYGASERDAPNELQYQAERFVPASDVEQFFHAGFAPEKADDLEAAESLVQVLDSVFDMQEEAKKDSASEATQLAVILRDVTKILNTQAELAVLARQAGHNVDVVDWRSSAAKLLSYIDFLLRMMYVLTSVFVFLALLGSSLAMSTAAMRRRKEVATLRALGSQPEFTLALFLGEAVLISGLAMLFGCCIGFAALEWLGNFGIPARTEILEFLFGGSRLFPSISFVQMVGCSLLTLAVAVASTVIGSMSALRVAPIQAMKEG